MLTSESIFSSTISSLDDFALSISSNRSFKTCDSYPDSSASCLIESFSFRNCLRRTWCWICSNLNIIYEVISIKLIWTYVSLLLRSDTLRVPLLNARSRSDVELAVLRILCAMAQNVALALFSSFQWNNKLRAYLTDMNFFMVILWCELFLIVLRFASFFGIYNSRYFAGFFLIV